MNKQTTKAIILNRVDYGDNDRIITVLTPDFGKLSLMARGVRKVKSKLAGGIELFAISDVGFITGRGQVGQLTSARLIDFYDHILSDIKRVQLGYDILRAFNRYLEDNVESRYFYLLCQLLRLLNDTDLPLKRIKLYFQARLLYLSGHSPRLNADEENKSLNEKTSYNLDPISMQLTKAANGRLKADHIKLLRLLFSENDSHKIFNIDLKSNQDSVLIPLIQAMFTNYLSL